MSSINGDSVTSEAEWNIFPGEDGWTVEIGSSDDPYDPKQSAFTWTGGARDSRDAIAMASADARRAWSVLATSQGIRSPFPARLQCVRACALHYDYHYSREYGDEINYVDAIAIGPAMPRLLGSVDARSNKLPKIADIDKLAQDALFAALTKVSIDHSDWCTVLEYGRAQQDADATNVLLKIGALLCEAEQTDVGYEIGDPWDRFRMPEPLRSAVVALSVAHLLGGGGPDKGIASLWQPSLPSATLRAAFRIDLDGELEARCTRVAAFLTSVGLDNDAEAFQAAFV